MLPLDIWIVVGAATAEVGLAASRRYGAPWRHFEYLLVTALWPWCWWILLTGGGLKR